MIGAATNKSLPCRTGLPPRRRWSEPTSLDLVNRRASGRRRYNAVRKLRADLRSLDVMRRMLAYQWARGAQARVAVDLGIDPSTVSRALKRLPQPPRSLRCPFCGSVRLPDSFEAELEHGIDTIEARIDRDLALLGVPRRAPPEPDAPRANEGLMAPEGSAR